MSKKFLQSVEDTHPPCTSEDPELFFLGLGADAAFQERRAKKVCSGCPLIVDCLEFALFTDDQHAVMGGTTPRERNAIKLMRDEQAAA